MNQEADEMFSLAVKKWRSTITTHTRTVIVIRTVRATEQALQSPTRLKYISVWGIHICLLRVIEGLGAYDTMMRRPTAAPA